MITITPPPLKHRLASMIYEAMLLFGVLFISAWLFSTLLQQRNALYLRHALQYWLFLIVGIYFVWFWTHNGQTLAMKTWRIKLVTKNGDDVKIGRAVFRYLLAWLWFAPGLALAACLGAKTWLLIWIPAANMLLWAAAIYLDPNRQFLHDRFAGTRLTSIPFK
ncbi:MAG: RDD family protein [Burkholderiaceae bacterium]